MPRKERKTVAETETSLESESGRVTLVLGHDTLENIEKMAVNGRFRGKGRTVDALVEAVWDSRQYVETFIKAGIAMGITQSNPNPSQQQQQQQQLVATMLVNAAVLADRLRKFVGVKPELLANQVKSEFEAASAHKTAVGGHDGRL